MKNKILNHINWKLSKKLGQKNKLYTYHIKDSSNILEKIALIKPEQIDYSFVLFELLNFDERKDRFKENKNIILIHINTYY